MREEELITSLLGNFSRSEKQKNGAFFCDAEIVSIGNQTWGITMDEFSPEEDLFGDMDPFFLGQNLATAVLSDLFACGAKPEFFMHSLVLSPNINHEVVNALMKGISSVLESANCFLLGGDIGQAENWRYTGVAMGPVCGDRYLSRRLPEMEQTIWVTGKLGDANLAAFRGNPAPIFELRLEEADYIRKNATSCIDTSGGFVDSAWLLKTLNRNLRFEFDMPDLPLSDGIIDFSRENNLPPQAFLFGGAGEYELLFTTPMNALVDIKATKIGRAFPSDSPGLFFNTGTRSSEIMEPPVCARETIDRKEYIHQILEQVLHVFG